ncbi:LRR receptor-like serine/threonine-protein kinase EFR [Juglans microcarpa x Juglans regia]|uniref:LRR receptor-like serine/threonine-protein kinase EFR n=1 Tax=Juglans microcarpa x Juglans regia TaxID=2249226 RepID=UPI001B7F3C36|nr:LRR receptor-like serine/threonine-protein kinase EFR [Juglans microcarpa x Juglans regia]
MASALEYFHYGYSTTIDHGDLKPSNILLDEDLVAHVADFGIAKLLGDGDSMMRTMTLATIGYKAPVDAAIPNIATDQSALLALKFGISHPDPDHNILASNWSTNTSVCSWIGVTCGSKHHRVIALNLAYMGLEGTIPPQIGNLSFLVSLGLRNNSFH